MNPTSAEAEIDAQVMTGKSGSYAPSKTAALACCRHKPSSCAVSGGGKVRLRGELKQAATGRGLQSQSVYKASTTGFFDDNCWLTTSIQPSLTNPLVCLGMVAESGIWSRVTALLYRGRSWLVSPERKLIRLVPIKAIKTGWSLLWQGQWSGTKTKYR